MFVRPLLHENDLVQGKNSESVLVHNNVRFHMTNRVKYRRNVMQYIVLRISAYNPELCPREFYTEKEG